MIEISAQITADDYVAFTRWYYRHAPAGRAFMHRLHGFGLLLFLVFAYLERDRPGYSLNEPLRYAFYLAVSFLVLGGLYHLFLVWLLPTVARMDISSPKRRMMLDPIVYQFSDAGIRVKTGDTHGQVAWRDVRGIAETNSHVYVLLGGMTAMILPKRAFPGEHNPGLAEILQTMFNTGHSMNPKESAP